MRGHTLHIGIVGAVGGGLAGYLVGGLGPAALWTAVGSVVGLLVGWYTPQSDLAASVTLGVTVGGILGGRLIEYVTGLRGAPGKYLGGAIVGLLVGAFAGTCIRTVRSALSGRDGSCAPSSRGHEPS